MLVQLLASVFSAHAEVVPREQWRELMGAGILRARGGSSAKLRIYEVIAPYSPRTRR